jgi:hypothetical protein
VRASVQADVGEAGEVGAAEQAGDDRIIERKFGQGWRLLFGARAGARRLSRYGGGGEQTTENRQQTTESREQMT